MKSRRTDPWRVAGLGALVALGFGAAAGAASPPNDPRFDEQWGLEQIRILPAWDAATGHGITIAIVDSGVDLTHPDLVDQLVPGATFFNCVGAGPCGDGHWAQGPPSVPSQHGTHVAGIAAARTNNALGIAGVARDAKIMSIKVIDDDGGTTDDIADGIDWARMNGARVINLSLGTAPGTQGLQIVGSFDTLHDAIERAIAADMVVIAAAGNEAASGCSEPAFHPDVLCVVATDPDENRPIYSNFALDNGLNAVAAPGGSSVFCGDNVLSTYPVGHQACGAGNGYGLLAGTSMASPHVAGLAAVLLSQGRSAENVYDALRETARTPITGERGSYTPTYGFGIVDAEAAVAFAPEPGLGVQLVAGALTLGLLAGRRRAPARH